MTTYCTQCGTLLTNGTCIRCAVPIPEATSVVPPSVTKFTDSITATGRQRTSGVLLGIGGGGLALSTVLPWITALDVVSARPSAVDILVLLAVGAATTFFGIRVLQGRTPKAIRPLLWVLSVLEALVVLLFFAAFHAANTATLGGVVSVSGVVSPAIGFYLAVLGAGATLTGTIVLQLAKGSPLAVAPHVQPRAHTVVPPVEPRTVTPPAPVAQPTNVPAPQPAADPAAMWWDGTRLRSVDDVA